MKKIYWIIASCIALIAIVVLVKFFKGDEPTQVITEKAEKRNIIETVSANGKIQPEAELKITSDVSGEVVEMYVKEGEQVKKGTLLCRIKPDIYESAFDRVHATVNSSKANLKTTMAQLPQAQASLVNVEAIFNRNKKLFEQSAISQQEFDISKANFESSKANFNPEFVWLFDNTFIDCIKNYTAQEV